VNRWRTARATTTALLAALAAASGTAAAVPVAHAASGPPSVRAPAAILVEPSTGDIVYRRKADDHRPIASTTKLMTALLALENLSLDDVLAAVPYHAQPAESVLGLRAGEKLTVRDYMRALLLASANDAAETLAVRVAGSERAFVKMMNARAKELGLDDTHYANPVGLDEKGNYSTASDLVKLALVLRQRAFFRETTDRPRATLRSGAHPRTILNRNTLVRSVPAVNGVKTGHTSRAGYILVGSATRDGVTVLSAVLGDPSEAARDADSLALLRYGLGRYHVVTAIRRGEELASVKLSYRDEHVALVAARQVKRTTRRGERLDVSVTGVPKEVDGPLAQGATVATVLVRQRGKVVARVPLVTDRAVSAASAGQRLKDFLGRGVTLLLLAAFLGGSLLLVLLRRRAVRRRRGPVGNTEIA
jgi:D-alanyl-D-alanine carboxypeptidase (penicillin-binding protein 5/6)